MNKLTTLQKFLFVIQFIQDDMAFGGVGKIAPDAVTDKKFQTKNRKDDLP